MLPKTLYFLCTCFMYAPALYQAKYLRDVWAIPAEKYGVMNLVSAFSIVSSLIWSGMADRFHAHRNILVLKSILYALSYCSMWALEPFIVSWSLNLKMSVITGLFFTTTVFCSAIFPLLGTLVFATLEASPDLQKGSIPPKRLLGRQKLFGTIGLGCVYAFNGFLTDYIGYRAQFLIVSTTCTLFSLVALLFMDTKLISSHKQPLKIESGEIKNEKAAPKTSFRKNVWLLLGNGDFLLLLFLVFVIGFVGSIFNVYLTIFLSAIMTDKNKRNNTSIGFINSIRLLVELPIYLFGDRLLSWFGPYGVLLMGMVSSAVRPFGYAFLVKEPSQAKLAFIFELFKGISHTTNAVGGCVLASELAPPEAQGTAQALFTSAHHHAASVLSGLFCSLFLNWMNISSLNGTGQIDVYRNLFFIGGVLAVIGSALNVLRILFGRNK